MNDLPPLPAALDVEKTVLGSMLIDQQAAVAAFDLFDETAFHFSANQQIFLCMKEMSEKAIPIDLITLTETLRSKQWLESIGDQPYLAELAENFITTANLPYHAEILIKKSKQRQLIQLCNSIARDAFLEDSDPGKLLEIARDRLERIDTGNDAFPKIIWGSTYNEVGIPDRKPELIGGILRRSHKLLIGAPSKAYKSFLAIRLGLAIASGRDWLGFQCAPGNVCIVNFEVDDGSYMHRVQSVGNALGCGIPDNIAFHHLRGYNTEIETILPAIARDIKGHDIAAVILDPQYKLLRSRKYPNISENDSACMAYLYGELDRHFARNNASPIIISHFAKGTASSKDLLDRIAGSGVFARDVDALCTLTALDTENAYRMEFALREFKTPEPLSLSWNYPLHQIDPMLDTVPLKRPGGRPGVSTGADDEAVFNAIQDFNGSMNQSAVIAELSSRQIGKTRVLNSLQRLTTSKKLTSSKGAHNATFYQIA